MQARREPPRQRYVESPNVLGRRLWRIVQFV